MVKIIEAKMVGRGMRIAIVVSRFHDYITKKLLDGCVKELVRCGVRKGDIVVAWTPGAFEIPLVAKRFARKKTVDAVIGLGAVIRGETYHFEMVAQGATQGMMQVGLDTAKPVIFGILTTETLEQAYKRSEEDGDNKGKDAAQAAIEMARLLEKI